MQGPLTLRRVRYRSSLGQRDIYPLDDQLKLPPGNLTPSLAQRAARLATHMSFATASEELQAQHGLRISDSTLDVLVQNVGGVADADRQQKLDQLAAAAAGVAREEQIVVEEIVPRPKTLCISVDGILYPTRLREPDADRPDENRLIYQEMKCGCVFWEDPDGRMHKRVIYGRDDPERFGLSVWQLAVQCGLLQTDHVVFISDGGTWCQSIYAQYFPEAVRIIDFFHLSEYVWKAAHGLYADPAQARSWAGECLRILKESSGMCLLRHLQRSRAARRGTNDQTLEPLDHLMAYLEPRVPYTDYSAYRTNDFPIGSGMMESTCKHLVGLRLKGSGRQWQESGALAMTALNALRINGQWSHFWNTHPQSRAA